MSATIFNTMEILVTVGVMLAMDVYRSVKGIQIGFLFRLSFFSLGIIIFPLGINNGIILQYINHHGSTSGKQTISLPISYQHYYCHTRQHDYDYTGESSCSTREISSYNKSLAQISFYGYNYIDEDFITIGY